MNRIVLRKCISEAKWLLLACALLLFLFGWIDVWIISLIDTSHFQRIIEPFWDDWSHMSPVSLDELLSYPGRIVLMYIDPSVLFVVAVWSIARGSDVVSGEVNRGTMEMLLAQPVSRLLVLRSQAAVTVGGVALLAAATWAGTATGIATVTVEEEAPPSTWRIPLLDLEIKNPFAPEETIRTPLRELVDAQVFIPAAFNLFSLGFCIAGLATLMSSWDRYRWRTVGLVAGVCVVQYIMKGFAVATERLWWLKRLTFFTAYEPQVFVGLAVDQPERAWSVLLLDDQGKWMDLGPLGYNLILLGIGLASYVAATVIFCRRDLPAPL
jgi:ABC-2 type transport system permease protein